MELLRRRSNPLRKMSRLPKSSRSVQTAGNGRSIEVSTTQLVYLVLGRKYAITTNRTSHASDSNDRALDDGRGLSVQTTRLTLPVQCCCGLEYGGRSRQYGQLTAQHCQCLCAPHTDN